MTELYCIFISALILVIVAYEWWAGRCRHEWEMAGSEFPVHKDRFTIKWFCPKCRAKQVSRFSRIYP